ncbi:MAG: acetate--CoA ligase family protein [Desulfuromonadales bacterium]|nr:acetate--CoA ligase family protein [Desulfuromonadales bacterium]
MSTATTPSVSNNTGAIERLLKPKSVVIVGASSTPGALGASTIANLDRMQYRGEVHLVNPNRDEIGGRRCLKSIDELPLGVDAAVLAIPRVAVLDTVKALARRQVGAAVIFSAGFAEGGEAGLEEQRELGRIATANNMVIEGPNCLGLVNYVDGVALTFVETPGIALGEHPGIGIVSQSGAMAAVLGVMLTSRELGVSYSISTGNEAASGVEDYIEYLLEDEKTAAIGMIVEQFRQPQRFIELARRAREQRKLIVLLHPGRSNAARESAATHTGAMAGDYQVMRVLVERAGVLVVNSLEELGDVLELAARCPTLPTAGSAVIAESGAFKALTLDLCEQLGLPLPVLTDASAPQLRAAMPDFVPVSNPLDLTAQALVDPDLYRRTLAALLDDKRFGCILFGIIQNDAKTADLKFPPIIAAIEKLQPQTPVIFAGLDEGAQVPAKYIQRLRELNIPYFVSPDRALRALSLVSKLSTRNFVTCEAVVPEASREPLPSGTVAEYRAKQLLAPQGIAFPPGRFVVDLEQAQSAAAEIGFPVVLKAQAADLSHKSDAGGVILNVTNDVELNEAWQRLYANIAQHCPDLALDGVLIEKMGQRGVEFIVGGRNDPEWGSVVLVGFGGVQAELMKDVRLLPPDLTIDGIISELQQLKQSALLRGFRGAPALDVEALAGIIARTATILRTQPEIREIDLNPVIVYPQGQGAIALDALMLIAQ